jgi:hypothetical protein
MKTLPTTEAFDIHPPIDEQEPTPEGLINVVEDRPAIQTPNMIDDEYCNRCDQKADVYRDAGLSSEIDVQASWLQDGERIRFLAWYNVDPDEYDQLKGWQITTLHHIDHAEKDIEDIARPSGSQAFATATLDRCGVRYEDFWEDGDPYEVEDRSVLRDVQVTSFSDTGFGDEPEPIREPNEAGIVELRHTDDRPNFPEELNTWRRELLKANDAWEAGRHMPDTEGLLEQGVQDD